VFRAARGNAREGGISQQSGIEQCCNNRGFLLTAPVAPCTRDGMGLQDGNMRGIHVRELGFLRPFDASLQYPQDSLL
jgi:hypothetical protein